MVLWICHGFLVARGDQVPAHCRGGLGASRGSFDCGHLAGLQQEPRRVTRTPGPWSPRPHGLPAPHPSPGHGRHSAPTQNSSGPQAVAPGSSALPGGQGSTAASRRPPLAPPPPPPPPGIRESQSPGVPQARAGRRRRLHAAAGWPERERPSTQLPQPRPRAPRQASRPLNSRCGRGDRTHPRQPRRRGRRRAAAPQPAERAGRSM